MRQLVYTTCFYIYSMTHCVIIVWNIDMLYPHSCQTSLASLSFPKLHSLATMTIGFMGCQTFEDHQAYNFYGLDN